MTNFNSVLLSPAIKEMLEELLLVVDYNAKAHEYLTPVVILGKEQDRQMAVIGVDFSSHEAKQHSHSEVVKIVTQSHPDFILKVFEGYYLTEADAEEHTKNALGPVSANPKRKEGLFVALETRFGNWSLTAEILPGREIKWEASPKEVKEEGLLCNLIPKVTVH